LDQKQIDLGWNLTASSIAAETGDGNTFTRTVKVSEVVVSGPAGTIVPSQSRDPSNRMPSEIKKTPKEYMIWSKYTILIPQEK
ncbi:MAG TPA: hypothetical protein VLJ68_06740, partial [Chitinophagaceae bacterium]|nr:hypothetical protein [Chitinophagaceae bacterium]